jgi:hypothetical protein
MKKGSRAAKLCRETNGRRDKGIAVAFMIDPSTDGLAFVESTISPSPRILRLPDSYIA